MEGTCPPPGSVYNGDEITVVGSGERDCCLRRGACSLEVDLACVRLAVELMERVGSTGWSEVLNKENGGGFGG